MTLHNALAALKSERMRKILYVAQLLIVATSIGVVVYGCAGLRTTYMGTKEQQTLLFEAFTVPSQIQDVNEFRLASAEDIPVESPIEARKIWITSANKILESHAFGVAAARNKVLMAENPKLGFDEKKFRKSLIEHVDNSVDEARMRLAMRIISQEAVSAQILSSMHTLNSVVCDGVLVFWGMFMLIYVLLTWTKRPDSAKPPEQQVQ